MSAIQQLLTDHIDIWTAAETEKKSGRGRASGNAGSVYGIKKLRELILELAVRGKLVPQDAADEPASALLKRIQAEKAKLIAEGKIKKEKPLAAITEAEKPFELPQRWELVKLGDVAYSQAGFAFKSNGFNESGSGLPLIRIRDVGQTFTGTYFDGEYRDEFVVVEGDYLISMDGEFRVARWLNTKALLNQRVSRLIYFGSEVAKKFVAEALQAKLKALQGVKAYTTVDHLSGGQISNSVLALPPLAEQYRIVAKVDELMALCDQLESQHSNAAEAHETLVNHLLGTLTHPSVRPELVEGCGSTGSPRTEFEENWQRIAAHFDTLFTTESSIDALKQTLLQLAVMGKLVPQDVNDEPASALLKRIQTEKTKLIAEGKIKKDKPLPPITEVEKPFDLPNGWEWVRVGMLFDVTSGGSFDIASEMDSGKYIYAKVGDMNIPENETEITTSSRFVNPTDKELRGLIPANSIIFPKRGGAIATNKKRLVTSEIFVDLNIMAITIPKPVSLLYTFQWLSGIDLAQLNTGTSVPQINHKDIEPLVFPLPPELEQHRIVAKADELMALCDQLKSRLADARQLQQKLADVLVEHAVA